MKKITKYILIVFIVVGCFFYLYSKGTYTFYETLIDKLVKPQIAKWNIKVDNQTVTTSTPTMIYLRNIVWDNTHTVPNKAVPGSVGVATIKIDPVNSNVAIKYTLDIVDKNVDPTKFLEVRNIRNENSPLIQTGENMYTGIISLQDIKDKNIEEIKLDLTWPNDVDLDPTSEEVNSSSNFIVINFQVEQYQGEEIVPFAG